MKDLNRKIGRTVMEQKNRIEWSLFLLRLGVFVVMFAWTVDKFVDPGHAAKIFDKFYSIGGVGEDIIIAIGVAQMLVILTFLGGAYKRWTYGFVMMLHGISTFASWKQYTTDINLLFFAAWPMLAACVALYLLRDLDNKFTLNIGK